MSKSLDRMRDERIKALIKQVDLRRESDMAERPAGAAGCCKRRSPSPTCRCINAASASWTRHERARRDAGCWLPIIGLCISIPVWRPR